MKFIIVEQEYEIGATAARMMQEMIAIKPNMTAMLAMGNTPMGMYREITRLKVQGDIDTSQLIAIQLDGYLGLPATDPRSLERWLRQSVVEPWEIPEEHVIPLKEDGKDPQEACRIYEQEIKRHGGIDLLVLGLGPNGHLGFNEPPSTATSPTRVVSLTAESLTSNARYWGGIDQVPRQSITAGMDLLLQSRQIILLVNGAHKYDILQKTVYGDVTPQVPSSFLQQHPNVTLIADQAAWHKPA